MILYHKYHLKCWNFNDFLKNSYRKSHEHHKTFMAFVYSLQALPVLFAFFESRKGEVYGAKYNTLSQGASF